MKIFITILIISIVLMWAIGMYKCVKEVMDQRINSFEDSKKIDNWNSINK